MEIYGAVEGAGERGDHGGDEAGRVVVAGLQPVPGHGHPRPLERVAPGGEQAGLAEAGRRGHQEQTRVFRWAAGAGEQV